MLSSSSKHNHRFLISLFCSVLSHSLGVPSYIDRVRAPHILQTLTQQVMPVLDFSIPLLVLAYPCSLSNISPTNIVDALEPMVIHTNSAQIFPFSICVSLLNANAQFIQSTTTSVWATSDLGIVMSTTTEASRGVLVSNGQAVFASLGVRYIPGRNTTLSFVFSHPSISSSDHKISSRPLSIILDFCLPGTYLSFADVQCIPCPPNTISSTLNAVECTPILTVMPSSAISVITTLHGVLILCCIFVGSVLYKNSLTLRPVAVPLCLMSLFGLVVSSLAGILDLVPPTVATCQMNYVFVFYGFSLAVVPILLKVARVEHVCCISRE